MSLSPSPDSESSASKRKRTKPWSPQEDELVQELVRQHGGAEDEIKNLGASNIKWLTIGSLVPGRTGKQCRERWHNLLNPLNTKQSWSGEEDTLIVACLRSMGTKWSDIAKLMHGRTDNAIKNRWYSTVRRVERYKRAGPHKQMFATPTDVRKNNNPLFHFCLQVHGKKNLSSFGPGEMNNIGLIAPAGGTTAANGIPAGLASLPVNSTVMAASSNNSEAGSTAMGSLASSTWGVPSLGGESQTGSIPLSYPSMTNVTVASAVDVGDLNVALQTPTRPTSRASRGSTGRGTPASRSRAGDSVAGGGGPNDDDSQASHYANAISSRRCLTPPAMLALPNSPVDTHMPYLRAGTKRKATPGSQKSSASSSASALKKAKHLGLKSDGLPHADPNSDSMPMVLHTDFVQSASEEQRAGLFDSMSPASSKLLSVPNSSTMQSPPSHISTPQSGHTTGSLSPFQTGGFMMPPTPPNYASPPNTTSSASTTSTHATSSGYTNSTTFPMPSPMPGVGSNNLSSQFSSAAAQAGMGGGLPPHPSPSMMHHTGAYGALYSPMPSSRPSLQGGMGSQQGNNLSTYGGISLAVPGGMGGGNGNVGHSIPLSPSNMLLSEFGAPTPGTSGNGAPYSNNPYYSLQTPAVGGSFGGGFNGSGYPMGSPAIGGGGTGSNAFSGMNLCLPSPGPFPMQSPGLFRPNSGLGSYTAGSTTGNPSNANNAPNVPFNASAAIQKLEASTTQAAASSSRLSLNTAAPSTMMPIISPGSKMISLPPSPSSAKNFMMPPPSPTETRRRRAKIMTDV